MEPTREDFILPARWGRRHYRAGSIMLTYQTLAGYPASRIDRPVVQFKGGPENMEISRPVGRQKPQDRRGPVFKNVHRVYYCAGKEKKMDHPWLGDPFFRVRRGRNPLLVFATYRYGTFVPPGPTLAVVPPLRGCHRFPVWGTSFPFGSGYCAGRIPGAVPPVLGIARSRELGQNV